jgi:hypothetical protein
MTETKRPGGKPTGTDLHEDAPGQHLMVNKVQNRP